MTAGGKRLGAGRKPREAGRPRKAISVTLSQVAYEALLAHAQATGAPLSGACEALIIQGAGWDLAKVVPQAAAQDGDEEGCR